MTRRVRPKARYRSLRSMLALTRPSVASHRRADADNDRRNSPGRSNEAFRLADVLVLGLSNFADPTRCFREPFARGKGYQFDKPFAVVQNKSLVLLQV